jgi:hypothetical protein
MLSIDIADHDGVFCFTVRAASGEFAGCGKAFFSSEQIMTFCADLRRLLDDPRVMAHLEGGYYVGGRLEHPVVRITCRRIGAGLRAKMDVYLAKYRDTNCLVDEMSSVTIPLLVAMEDIITLAGSLQSIPNHLDLSCEMI